MRSLMITTLRMIALAVCTGFLSAVPGMPPVAGWASSALAACSVVNALVLVMWWLASPGGREDRLARMTQRYHERPVKPGGIRLEIRDNQETYVPAASFAQLPAGYATAGRADPILHYLHTHEIKGLGAVSYPGRTCGGICPKHDA